MAADLGLGGVILFGIPAHKDATGSEATSDKGIVSSAVQAIKKATPDLLVITDVCFCEYTDHGHCGVISQQDGPHGRRQRCHAGIARLPGRGACPRGSRHGRSQRHDGRHGRGHSRPDWTGPGLGHVPILSYAAKYASAFYGPFREAAESAPQFGDRRGYQMDPAADPAQALREVELDLAEGADMIMVKPALAYLDILRSVRDRFPGVPLAAYNVSGEYSMIKAAAAQGWLDERAAALESLLAIRRAGAGIVLTYWAKQVAQWLADSTD